MKSFDLRDEQISLFEKEMAEMPSKKKRAAKQAAVVQPVEVAAVESTDESAVRINDLIESQEQADAAEAETAVVASAAAKPARATADCESAKEESCSCRCRGKYHGKEHPKGWKDEAGCEPLNAEERKLAKKNALYSWRKAHPERVSAYMKQWREERKKTEAENAIVEASESAEEGEAEAE